MIHQNPSPFDEERDLHHFITQETRYLILQYILAHPENLPSLKELNYAIPRSESTIREHLELLQEENLVNAYELEGERRQRDLPKTFFGFTDYGITVADQFNLLDAKGALQAFYDQMEKPDRIQEFEAAPRPERRESDVAKDELEEEAERVAEAESSEERTEAARKTAGLANTLAVGSTDETGGPERLGKELFKALGSSDAETRNGVVAALAQVADGAPSAVIPALPLLGQLIEDADLEFQRNAVVIGKRVAAFDSDQLPPNFQSAISEICNHATTQFDGGYSTSKALLEECHAFFETIGADQEIAATLLSIGTIARKMGEFDEAQDNLEKSLSISRDMQNRRAIASVLNELGSVFLDQGDYGQAQDLYEEGLELHRELDARQGIAYCLGNLGLVARNQGDYEGAREYHQESLEINRELGDRQGIANSLGNLGLVARYQGDYEGAREYHQESLEIKRELDDRQGIANSLGNLGSVARSQGDYEEAREYHQESLELERELGNRRGIAISLGSLGSVARFQGDYEEAREYFEEGLELFREINARQGIAKCLGSLGLVAQSLGDYEGAREYHQESLEIKRELGARQGIASSLLNLGSVAQSRGDYEEAREYFEESLEINRELGARQGIASSLGNLGSVARSQGHHEEARKYFEESLELERELGNRRGIAKSLHNFGRAAFEADNSDKARKYFKEALEIQREIETVRDALQTIRYLLRLSVQEDETEAAQKWCEIALSIIESADISGLENQRAYFRRKQAEMQAPSQGVPALYELGLDQILERGTTEGTELFRDVWRRRDDLDAETDEFRYSVAAGVLLVAQMRLRDMEEMTIDQEEILDTIETHRKRLPAPAEVLYSYLASDGEALSPEAVLDARDPVSDNHGFARAEMQALHEMVVELQELELRQEGQRLSGAAPDDDFGEENRIPQGERLAD